MNGPAGSVLRPGDGPRRTTGREVQQQELLDYVRTSVVPRDRGHQLRIIPNVGAPQFAVFAESASVACRSLLTHNAIRPLRTQARRAAAALAIAIAASAPLPRPAPRAITPASSDGDGDEGALIDHLADLLGVRQLSFAIGLSRFGPYAKPVLQLFDQRGAAVGYAKVGWNPLTAELVVREKGALDLVADAGPRSFSSPRVLAYTVWRNSPVLVTEPLPDRSRRMSLLDFPPTAAAWELAGVAGAPRTGAVADLELVRSASGTDTAADRVIGDAAASIVDLVGDVEVPIGFSHGDLVPWNTAVRTNRLWIWDWEYARAGLPVGIDIVHGLYQCATEIDRRPVPTALAIADAQSRAHFGRLGFGPQQTEAILLVHRLELMRREARARTGRAGAARLHALARTIHAARRAQ